MTRYISLIAVAAALLAGHLPASAYTFAETNEAGKTIYYNIASTATREGGEVTEG